MVVGKFRRRMLNQRSSLYPYYSAGTYTVTEKTSNNGYDGRVEIYMNKLVRLIKCVLFGRVSYISYMQLNQFKK